MGEENSLGLVQVYWGKGKGKTTAALGLCLRALGRGKKVHLVQFLKGGIEGKSEFEEYGELKSLKKFRDFSLKRFGIKEWVVGKPSSGHIAQGAQALGYSFKAAAGGKYDLLIIDEILYAVQLGVIGEQGVLGLIAAKAPHTELVLTGSHKPFKKIFEKAGLITEMKKHKHPYDKGIGAREGIEF